VLASAADRYQSVIDARRRVAHPCASEGCHEMIGIGNERRRVFDALPRLVWTALAGGHIDFHNRRCCEYTGFSSEEAYVRGWQTAPTLKTESLRELPECW